MTAGHGQEPEFQDLLFGLSAAFVAVPADEVDTEIERWLGRLVVFLGVDRSGIAQVSLDGRELRATHSWAVEGVPTSRSPIW